MIDHDFVEEEDHVYCRHWNTRSQSTDDCTIIMKVECGYPREAHDDRV